MPPSRDRPAARDRAWHLGNSPLSEAAEPNPEEQNISAAIATVARCERNGAPSILEVDGVLYERPFDQREARKCLEECERLDEIRATGVPHSLLAQVEMDVAGHILDGWRNSVGRERASEHLQGQRIIVDLLVDDIKTAGEQLFDLAKPNTTIRANVLKRLQTPGLILMEPADLGQPPSEN